ncbi:putative membrane protein [[Clostridium] sordellii ATCC 9714]|nr:putative membrane protein [[Clostridium] sordellii ATCC 9714] [Paeniclostridium sordellii ATCC 9714]
MEKKITGLDYLYLSLYAFAGIGLELILVGIIEPYLAYL